MSRLRSTALFVVALGAAAAWPGAARAAGSAGVEIADSTFTPAAVEVNVGDTVVWTNIDNDDHSVRFGEGGFDSHPGCQKDAPLGGLGSNPCLKAGQSVSHVFKLAGTFDYACRRHAAMTGSVVVVDPSEATPSTPTSGGGTTTTRNGAGASPTSTSTTVPRGTTLTSREHQTSSTVLRSTTTTAGISYAPVTQGPAPAFDPDKDEDTSPVATPETVAGGDGEAASGGNDGDSGGGGSAAVVALVIAAVAGGGGALLWKLRPKGA